MVNSGVTEVGVITKSNYQSLLDHLGNGREWDLSGKNGGLHLLPPFSHVGSGMYRGRIEALFGVWNFVEHSSADYVMMSDCDVVANINYKPVVLQHIESGADITVLYARSRYDVKQNQYATIYGIDETGRINDVMINPQICGECNISLNSIVIKKTFLKKIVQEAASRSLYSFERDILQAKKDEYKIMGYEYKGYFSKIDSMISYYNANMDLLNGNIREELFTKDRPIYTKIRDSGPAKFGLESSIKNSLIADGCIVNGTVENSILFRGVKIGKGTTVKNCIVMQDTVIGKESEISFVITDKIVQIGSKRVLTGSETYPLYIGKAASI
jgi:glucose-1-phosphate adenylyltransferase